MRKKYFIIVALIAVTIVSYYAYIYIAPAKPFYSKNEVAELLQVTPADIQEIYEAEQKYRFVPYKKDGQLYMSFWAYKNKWEKISVYTGHDILQWTIKNKVRYIVWHYDADNAAELSIYGVQPRDYHVSTNEKGEEIARYFPQIVLQEVVEQTSGTNFGMFKIPKDWDQALTRTPVPQSFNPFDNWQMALPLFQYAIVDQNGEVVETVGTGNNYGETFSKSSFSLDYLMYFNPYLYVDEEEAET